FKSGHELDQSDSDARENAELVDRHIARLVDSIRELESMCKRCGMVGNQLGQKLKALKGRIPASQIPGNGPGDDDDDDEEDMPFGPQPGQAEGPSRAGKETVLTSEQAGWLLESFKLGGDRKLPLGEGKPGQPKDRSRPTW